MAAFLLLVVVMVLVIALVGGANRGKRTSMLGQLAAELGGTADGHSASGTVDGVTVRYAFETRGSGSSSESWTYVDCALPRGYPFVLFVERHGFFDAGKIARGDMVDVVVGDPAFDERYRVEGAPAEVVRQVLTPDARAYLMAERRLEISTLEGALRLAIPTWLETLEEARPAIATATAIAGAVRGASLALDAEQPLVVEGPAYRAIASDLPLQEARAARAAEVDEVSSLRANRLAGQHVVVIAIVVAVAAVAALAALAGAH